MGGSTAGRCGMLAGLLAALLLGGGFALAQDEKKPGKGKKPPDGEMEEKGAKGKKPPDGEMEEKPAKGKAKAEKPGKDDAEKPAIDDGADDPVYAKRLKKLRQDIEKAFRKQAKPLIYVYTHSEKRQEIDEGQATGKFTNAKQTLVPKLERVCKQSEDREKAVEETYDFVAEYPPFEKKMKKSPKKNVLDIGAPPRPVREWALVGAFPATEKGKLAAAAALEKAEKEFDQYERAVKAAKDARMKKK